MIKTLDDAERALLPYVPLVAQLTGKDTTLERIVPLMQLVGNPQDRLKAVHIAGTSGKTSTAYFIAALLTAAGNTVGLTVSPHVDALNERVQINGQPLPEAEFCMLLQEFLELIAQAKQQPSYFELLYAFALWIFDRKKVDYAVVETGLGGLHDATNVITRQDKICVITDIGYDHVNILGKTLAAITTQKIGIVHKKNTVVMYQQSKEVMDVVEDWVKKQQAHLIIAEQDSTTDDFIGTVALFQQRNWWLAAHVYQILANRDNLQRLTRQALRETQLTYVPGRIDTVQEGDHSVVMDGAHNAQKMEAFISSFKTLYPRVKPAVLLAMKQGKDYAEVVPMLSVFASRIIITTFNSSQDLPAVSLPPNKLQEAFMQHGFTSVSSIPNQELAYQKLLAGPERIVVVTGSFYLLSQLRHTKHYHD